MSSHSIVGLLSVCEALSVTVRSPSRVRDGTLTARRGGVGTAEAPGVLSEAVEQVDGRRAEAPDDDGTPERA